MNASSDDVLVIVRTVGERTQDACYDIASQQLPMEHIIVISETPFARAVQRTFEIGTSANLMWTIALDADVLLARDAISTLVHCAEALPADAFGVQLPLLDKFFGLPRGSGVHCYRTAFLEQAKILLPEPGESMRPETYVKRRMVNAGHPWLNEIAPTIGVHGYEQYYADIFRTCFVHARKHPHHVIPLLPWWERAAAEDADYRVALWGFRAGQVFDGPVSIDAGLFTGQAVDFWLSMANMVEKEPLGICAGLAEEVTAQLIYGCLSSESFTLSKTLAQKGTGYMQGFASPEMQARAPERSLSSRVTYRTGQTLQKIGRKLMAFAER